MRSFPEHLVENANLQLAYVESFLRACGEHYWASKVFEKWRGNTAVSGPYDQLQAEMTQLVRDVLSE